MAGAGRSGSSSTYQQKSSRRAKYGVDKYEIRAHSAANSLSSPYGADLLMRTAVGACALACVVVAC
jgi:hypothetical protein